MRAALFSPWHDPEAPWSADERSGHAAPDIFAGTSAVVKVFGRRRDELSTALTAGGRKAPRHEIAGSGALTAQRALLEIDRCTEIQRPLILNGCGRGKRLQLWRYGMDIAKWGKHLSGHT